MSTRLASLSFAWIGAVLLLPGLAGAFESKAERKVVRAADGVNLVCDISGKGDTALVFLHGWCGDHEYWKKQVNEFASEFQIVTIDQAGHGRSGKDRKEWTVSSLAGDVATVVKTLGLKRVVLIGHSMGGPVALLAAKQLPGTIVAVIGVDTLQDAEQKASAEMRKQITTMFETDFKGTLRAGFGGMLHPKSEAELKTWLTDKALAQDQTMALALFRDFANQDMKAMLQEAKCPVRCINSAGGFQFYVPTAVDVNKKYADFDAVLIEGVGHYPMLEKPAEFNEKLHAVLKELKAKE